MQDKRLKRQIKKHLESLEFKKDYEDLLAFIDERALSAEIPKARFIEGLLELMEAVERAYNQADKMLEISNHSLDMSSRELNQVNKRLKEFNALVSNMMNSLSEGFLILNRDGVCSGIVSKKAEDFFAKDPRNLHLVEILDIPEDEVTGVKEWYEFMFTGAVGFDSLVDLGPQSYACSESKRQIHIDYKPIYEDGKLSSVVMIATDITSEIEAQREARQMTNQAEMILQRFRFPEAFARCLEMVRETIGFMDRKKGEKEGAEYLQVLRRKLHTLKGALASQGIIELADIVDQVETDLGHTRAEDKAAPVDVEKLSQTLGGGLSGYMRKYGELLSLNEDNPERSVSVAESQVTKFFKLLKEHAPNPVLIESFYETFCKVKVTHFFAPVRSLALRQAVKRGKAIDVKICSEEGLTLDPHQYPGLIENMSHLINNAVDHGIEDPNGRADAGKDPVGRIDVACFQLASGELSVVVEDDGKGLDVSAIREKALAVGLIHERASDDEVIDQIFAHGFSTKAEADSISGRGVGLDACLAWAKSLGGTIKVKTNPGVGTRVEIVLPCAWRSAAGKKESAA